MNERFEQYINGKRENLHSNFTLRLKKILWEARSAPTLESGFLNTIVSITNCCTVLLRSVKIGHQWGNILSGCQPRMDIFASVQKTTSGNCNIFHEMAIERKLET
jgi:hypothetical protein